MLRVILSLENSMYHKNVLMIIQSLGFTGYPSLSYGLIAHSTTLAHPEQSHKHTSRRLMDDNEVHPKRPGKGGSKVRLFETTK